MEVLLRVIAIVVEVVILAAIMYSILTGVWLTVFDLGIGLKYKKILTVVLVLIGCIAVFFFIAHLTAFYPTISV